jgi:hypothetical protein
VQRAIEKAVANVHHRAINVASLQRESFTNSQAGAGKQGIQQSKLAFGFLDDVLSPFLVLGWLFVDALMVMLLAVTYLLLTRRHSHWGEPETVGTAAALETHKD